jgi:carbon-monoxide dehydrogenase large subunit
MNPSATRPALSLSESQLRGLKHSQAGSDELLTGGGQFCADLQRPGDAHLCFVRSPHAHARILAIDAVSALLMPGVLAVWSGEDLQAKGVLPMALVTGMQRADGSAAMSAPRHVLAHERVRHVGEACPAWWTR